MAIFGIGQSILNICITFIIMFTGFGYFIQDWMRFVHKDFDADSSEDTLDEPIVWFESVRQL